MLQHHRSLAALAVVGMVSLGVIVGPGSAAAAAPANDTRAGAVAINSLPFNYSQDTTRATVDDAEFMLFDFCMYAGAPAFEHAVWFRLTVRAGSANRVLIDAATSSYPVGLAVVQVVGGSLVPVDCVPGMYATLGEAATYYVVAFDDGSLGSASGGRLVVHAELLPPPPTVTAKVNSVGTATKAGGVWISGTVTCTGTRPTDFVDFLYGEVTQRVGRLFISSSFELFSGVACDGAAHPWKLYAPRMNGRFSGGKATVVLQVTACGVYDCSEADVSTRVQLRRGRI